MRQLFYKIILNPVGILYMSWFFIVINYNITYIAYDGYLSVKLLVYVILFLLVFTMGYFFGGYFIFSGKKYKIFEDEKLFNVNKYVTILAAAGILGSLLMSFDFIYVRGIDYSQGLSYAREMLYDNVAKHGVQGRVISIIARSLICLSSAAAFVSILRYENIKRRIMLLVLIGLFLEVFADALTGSRNPISMTFSFILMACVIRKVRGQRILPQSVTVKSIFFLSLIVLFVYFSYIFVEREQMQGRDLVGSLTNLEEGFLLTISKIAYEIVNGEDYLAYLLFAMTFLQLYLTHGLNELDMLIQMTPVPGPFYGLYTFYIPAMLAEKLNMLPDGMLIEVANSTGRHGVYQTILGSLYLDFGIVFSLIVVYFWGILTGFLWRRMRINKNVFVDMLCAYMLLVIIWSPVYMIINYGNGFQILLAIIIGGLVYLTMKENTNKMQKVRSET